jgi:formylglycine-generating enzyme required for sulfatase activity
VIAMVVVFSCAKLGDRKIWNNPGDPEGVNWYPPVVNVPLDTDVAINDTVRFLANGSDENGSVVRYQWSLDHGVTWTSESAGVSFSRSFDRAGEFEVWVRAEDNDGTISPPDSFTVRVHEYRPRVTPVSDTVVSQSAVVSKRVLATDTNGPIVRYYWKTGSEKQWSDSSSSPVLAFSHPQGGGLPVVWAAIDQDGFVAIDTFTVLFNRGPTQLAMLDPSDGDTVPFLFYNFINETGSVKFRFQAKDPDTSSDIIVYRLFIGKATTSLLLRYSDTAGIFQADSLSPSATYHWKLIAQDRFGDSIVKSGSFLTQKAPVKPRGMVLIRSAGKSFQMGNAGGESFERPVHQAGFSQNYWIDTVEVSQQEYGSLLGIPAPDPLKPVANVNWYDAVLYCNARSKRDNKDTVYRYTSITGVPGRNCILSGLQRTETASGYRLPTEAEWEYACRAGTTSDYYWGDRLNVESYAWYRDNSNGSAKKSGLKKANALGLYDMAGNVWEWCNDWFGNNYYQGAPPTDPRGPAEGDERVIRGGSWMHNDYFTGSGVRSKIMPVAANASIGFRVALPQP